METKMKTKTNEMDLTKYVYKINDNFLIGSTLKKYDNDNDTFLLEIDTFKYINRMVKFVNNTFNCNILNVKEEDIYTIEDINNLYLDLNFVREKIVSHPEGVYYEYGYLVFLLDDLINLKQIEKFIKLKNLKNKIKNEHNEKW